MASLDPVMVCCFLIVSGTWGASSRLAVPSCGVCHTENTLWACEVLLVLQGPVCSEELNVLPVSLCPGCTLSRGCVIFPSCLQRSFVYVCELSTFSVGFRLFKFPKLKRLLSYLLVSLPWSDESQMPLSSLNGGKRKVTYMEKKIIPQVT